MGMFETEVYDVESLKEQKGEFYNFLIVEDNDEIKIIFGRMSRCHSTIASSFFGTGNEEEFEHRIHGGGKAIWHPDESPQLKLSGRSGAYGPADYADVWRTMEGSGIEYKFKEE